MTVTINREKLKQYIKQQLALTINNRISKWSHTNSDSYYSPSEWWVDALNGSIRHQLKTDINSNFNDDKLTINLMFEVIDIS